MGFDRAIWGLGFQVHVPGSAPQVLPGSGGGNICTISGSTVDIGNGFGNTNPDEEYRKEF